MAEIVTAVETLVLHHAGSTIWQDDQNKWRYACWTTGHFLSGDAPNEIAAQNHARSELSKLRLQTQAAA